LFVLAIIILFVVCAYGITPAIAGPKSHFLVSADTEWYATGFEVESGDFLNFSAYGYVILAPLNEYRGAKSGPDGQEFICPDPGNLEPCALNGAPYGALIGKIGPSGTPFFIGSSLSMTAAETGELSLIVNDNLGWYFDNYGNLMVFIMP
jgi:hypothetical protein